MSASYIFAQAPEPPLNAHIPSFVDQIGIQAN